MTEHTSTNACSVTSVIQLPKGQTRLTAPYLPSVPSEVQFQGAKTTEGEKATECPSSVRSPRSAQKPERTEDPEATEPLGEGCWLCRRNR